jgi:hypothetical protein
VTPSQHLNTRQRLRKQQSRSGSRRASSSAGEHGWSSLAQATLWPWYQELRCRVTTLQRPRIEDGRPVVAQKLHRLASPERTLEGKSYDEDRLSANLAKSKCRFRKRQDSSPLRVSPSEVGRRFLGKLCMLIWDASDERW